ncbi:MAG: RecQ family ATP-dependent DNA helicase [Patiriisocius sp.]|uniref:RecQ family ATP-dependent DNA helicase n=1 Tax=Patiriisocius sp. TaxID=2822396 RepID=UPI003EFA3674
MNSPQNILEKYWGYTSFRPKQEEIINSVLNGIDTVALLPTGGGKSVCFQIPALINDGICIVISPLVALMTDQVNALNEKGIKAMEIKSGTSFQQLNILLDNACYGNFKFLYLSPERLQQEVVQNAIKRMPVNCIAIDEAHCISQWGNDFRPAYKNITVLRDIHPLVPFIALTATATPEVLEDLTKELKLELPNIVKNSFVRENLSYQVHKVDDKLYKIEQLLKDNKAAAIVYARTRKNTIQTSKELNTIGIKSDFYHGGISSEEKTAKLGAWKNGITPTIVATNAFGMGIDLAHVRHVIHIQLPESIESYYQEAGRAGRDGEYAIATILYNEYDKKLVKNQFIDSLADATAIKLIYRKLSSHLQIPYGEGLNEEFSFDFKEFCTTYSLNTLRTFNGLNTLDRLGIIQLSKQFGQTSKMRFLVSSNRALEYFNDDPLQAVIGKTILRLYGGIFETTTNINLQLVKSKTNQSISTIISALKKMEKSGIIELKIHTTDASLSYILPREDDKTINRIAKEVNRHNEKKKQQVAQMIGYIENDNTCRSVQLATYFGDNSANPCGICFVCSKESVLVSKAEMRLISEKIMQQLETSQMTSRELTETLTFTESKILKILQVLVNAGKLGIGIRNEYYLK